VREHAFEVSQCVTCGSGGGNLRQRRGEKGLVGHGVIGGGGAAVAEKEGPRGTVRGSASLRKIGWHVGHGQVRRGGRGVRTRVVPAAVASLTSSASTESVSDNDAVVGDNDGEHSGGEGRL